MIIQYELQIDDGQKIIDYKRAKKTAIKEAERLTLEAIKTGEWPIIEVKRYEAPEDLGDKTDWALDDVIWSNI